MKDFVNTHSEVWADSALFSGLDTQQREALHWKTTRLNYQRRDAEIRANAKLLKCCRSDALKLAVAEAARVGNV
jgi:hypothetical protein